ncbi:hypothetical protein H8356DRAFT_1645716 [Neocallimastix lanati (nom. inval.)]|jgi:coiled-coil domain-containing protein 77|uniref:Uncharacterized protein n=1 Tax=Neocallimastix californiae TaxID=1754190 RepID=A0A1Y2AZG0_9FUNG|nr:hypothetical protein H8356DRAFT_1645716 [Neocallimastix sp. JGI-2020a]ORY27969.1 hypothetical protein LY90DRAFT_92095 [Neocallimastix californiae]|eukprot:ORY27969.1 hypothetical protein LY90DRAFT_92095 [Neocallimastix californiae]
MITNNEQKADIEELPLSQDLLQYYKNRLENFEKDYEQAIKLMDGCRVSHEEYFNLTREVQKKTKEVTNLRKLLSDAQLAIFNERNKLLKVLAENDELKIQEMKDQRKIRYLLGLVETTDEITYFKKGYFKKYLQNIKKKNTGVGDSSENNNKVTVQVEGEQNNNTNPNGIMDEEVVFDNENIYIVNDEIEGLKLTISSLKAQIDEQKKENERHIEGYKKDKQYRINENESQQKYYFEQIISLTDKINKLRSICRENTKELIKTKSNAKMLDKKTKSQLARYAEDMRILKNCFTEQKDKCNDLKKNMKIKISKKNDDIINNLRKQLGKYEEELKIEKSKNQNIDEKYKKKIEILNNKIKKINSNYKSLEKRRDCEIEGFTNDILRLRKQLKALENHLVNTESPLDKEMELLNLARNTGKRAEKMTEEIKKYKNKISNIEKQIHTLAF